MNLDISTASWLIWFLLGTGLAFLELYLPGFVVLCFGIGCWATVGALLFWELSLTHQILLFVTTSITSLVLLRKWLMRVFRGTSSDKSEDEFDDFPKGARVTVLKSISPGRCGRIQYRGTAWDAEAEETIEVGATVEIERYAANSRQIFFVRRI